MEKVRVITENHVLVITEENGILIAEWVTLNN